MLNLFRYELSSRRMAIVGWGVGLAAVAAMYVAVYPEFAAEMGNLAGIALYKALGIDLASFAGFIASVVVQIMPLILGVYVIIAGTGTLAGEEEAGTLEMVVATPMPRWQIVTTKFVALAIILFLILLITGAGAGLTLSYVSQTTEVDATPAQLISALLAAWPLMVAFLAVALFVGTVSPNRRIASGIMALIYIGSYVINSIANLIESLAWLKTFSLFNYVNSTTSVFEEGASAGDVAVLLGVAVVFFGLALWFFQQRNITVGAWPWQRGRVPTAKS